MVELSDKATARLRYGIQTLSGFPCEHVMRAKRNGAAHPDAEHCDKRDKERGACCNGCWVRRWAESMRDAIPENVDPGDYRYDFRGQ